MARVLILDDDVGGLAALRRDLRAAGHDAAVATSAADALAAMESPAPPDLLLAAPAADGGEALALAVRARAEARLAWTAVLLVGAPAEGAPAIPSVPRGASGEVLAAAVARAVTSRPSGPRPTPALTADPGPTPAPPPRPAPLRGAVAGAEAALRALFRRGPAARDEAEPAASRAPAPAAAAARGPARADPDLPHLLHLARHADYFTLLGLTREAAPSAARDAAARLLGELDARRLAGEGSPDLDELRQVLRDARDVLGDPERGREYLKALGD